MKLNNGTSVALAAALGLLITSATGAANASAAAASTSVSSGIISPAPSNKGQVVFFRKPMFAIVPFNWIVREGGVEICEMVAGTYCVATVEPGTHNYEVHSEVKNGLTLEVDAGETYYVLGEISLGIIVNRPNILPVDNFKFDAMSAKLKPRAAFVSPAAAPVAEQSTATATPTPTVN